MTEEEKWPKVEDHKEERMSVKVQVDTQKGKTNEGEKSKEVAGGNFEKANMISR